MKSILVILGVLVGNLSFSQTPGNCNEYTTTGTVDPYGSGYTDPNAACGANVPGISTAAPAVWTGASCAGILVSTVTGPPVSCLVLSYGAVNTNDYGTISTDTGGNLTLTGVNMGVNGNVIGPYNCGTGSYGNVLLTVCSDIPFNSVTLTNTGCTSGWVINCADQGTCSGGGNAGGNGTATICNTALDLNTLVTGDPGGTWVETTVPASGQFNTGTGVFDSNGLPNGTYTFEYSVVGCATSTATMTVTVDCGCNIDVFNASIGLCEGLTDTYTMSGDVSFTQPPAAGTLVIEVDNGTTTYDTIINPPFVSPQTWSISGIPSDGSASTVTVYFTDNLGCTQTINYNAPASCACNADIGTFTTNITGQSGNNYVLCYGDQIDLNSNNDWSDPGEMFNPPGPPYDPGVSWLMYSCPPTVALTPHPIDIIPDDPCFLGLVSDNNFTDLNDLTWINSYPPGTFTNNTIYFVPITMYSQQNGTYSFVNGASLPCYELGAPYAVQYLPDFTSSFTEDCFTGTADVTVNGALPEIDGSNFTASNLMPVSASFVNSTAPDGGIIQVQGLQGGDMWSFDVTDNNGCTYNISGGPFPPLDDATFDYPNGLTYCQTGVDPTANVTGIPGGTFSYTTVSGGPNLTLNPATGGITLNSSDLGVYDITYNTTGGVGSICPQTSTLQLTITPAPIADFTFGIYCANDTDPMPTFINGGTGGNFSAVPAGLSINPATGEVDLDGSTPGTYTVTNSINVPGCATVAFNDDITVNELPDATISGTATICNGDPLPDVQIDVTAGIANWDITYNVDGAPTTVNTGAIPYIISGAAIGTYDLVSITDGNGCTNTISGQVVVAEYPVPVMAPLVNHGVCHGDQLTVQTFASNPPGATFVWTNTSGIDVGFGLNGTGDIGTFTGTNTGTVPEQIFIDVTPTSSQGCPGVTDNFFIMVNPLPQVAFTGTPLVGCEPLTVEFTNQTQPIGALCEWDFGNGNQANGCGLIYNTYMAGTYDVSLTVTTAEGCTSSDTYASYVTVTPRPEALFTFSPQVIDVSDTEVNFNNGSINANAYTWNFGDASPLSFVANPTHLYPVEPMQYTVTLIAHDANDWCPDTSQQIIVVDDVIIFYVPNIVTPDGDLFNEVFQPVFTSGYDKYDYHLTIFNRWGEIVFESYDADAGWNGHYGDGGLVQDGVYVWQIDFAETMSDKRHTHRGHVTVLK